MKIRTSLIHLTTLALCVTLARAQNDPPLARIVGLSLDPQRVTVLSLRPGFVTSVRLPEEVSSVVLGDPGAFKGEHSEAEPRLVFFKPTVSSSARSNALINMRSGRQVSLTLVSEGSTAHGPVDYVLEYELPRSFVISATASTFVVSETKRLDGRESKRLEDTDRPRSNPGFVKPDDPQGPDWQGRHLRVSVGRTEENGEDMTVNFSVLNSSSRTIELLPPQVQLSGTAKQRHGKTITAEPVAIKDYRITSRKLEPGATAEGFVVFERPAFKQSTERLLLQIAQAEEVDRPVVAAIRFVAPTKGAMQ